jgi:hypothetical protein
MTITESSPPLRIDKTALSYWFPKLQSAGLPVPVTTLLAMPVAAQESIWAAFDGKDVNVEAVKEFFGQLGVAAAKIGFPCFLRTDHTSGKHSWNRTCFLTSVDDIPQHVFDLAEYSEIVDLIGLPWDTWVVREFLPTIPLGTCKRYGGMPICREFRFFVDGGSVRCWHPYWPPEAMQQGEASEGLDYEALCRMDNEVELSTIAAAAGKAVGGSWSVDILETKRGWMVTDMAEANKSYHWKGCPHADPPRK